jgi:1-acyl-sn-glycerol-3-phosphate acyltransferase
MVELPWQREADVGSAIAIGGRVQYRVSRAIAGPILHLLWRPSISGAGNVPSRGGAILASNHLSIVDSFFLPLMLDRPVTFAAKSEYFTGTRLVDRAAALYLRRTNQLAVDRARAGAARGMLEAALDLLRRGELFGIYPEGTRSPDGRLYRGRTGVGWLALASGLPVVPVAMMGTDHVLPPGRTIPRLGPIEVRVGKPMAFEQHTATGAPAKARRAITDEVMRAIRELSGQEYVPVYASTRKEQLAGTMRDPGER